MPANTPAETPAGLAAASNCLACHDVSSRRVGPSFREVADRYKGQSGAAAMLAQRVRHGGQGVWGPVPMPANAGIADEAVERIVGWILDGAP